MSPGSLYQFFPNKDAIAEALATRYLAQPHATQTSSFAPEIVHLPLDALIDRVVDPLVALHVAHPGFWTLFGGSTVSPRLIAAAREFLEAVHERAEAMFAVRAPHLSPGERTRCAKVSVQLIRALLPLLAAADPAEQDAVLHELKAAQPGYLAPILAGQRLVKRRSGIRQVSDCLVAQLPQAFRIEDDRALLAPGSSRWPAAAAAAARSSLPGTTACPRTRLSGSGG